MLSVTGASGPIYAVSFLRIAVGHWDTVYLTISENAAGIARDEIGTDELASLLPVTCRDRVVQLDPSDLWAAPASGSHEYDGLAVIPCSAGTLGRIAAGVSDDLATRAADVCLKERRKLVLVVREAPLNLIQIENMAAVTRAGGVILPASPAFYTHPKKIEDLADFVAARVAAQFGIPMGDDTDWGRIA